MQNIPISITALSQEQLTATQTAGGPDLVKQVPNLTFTKTNFSGYNIQIRGIGTQAISVTTDPAVAVAFNDIPFIRNHFFEQEFYDVSQVEVLRGPQGTLYGRNATAGVVNLVSAKPTDQFEAMASADVGNYDNRRFEGMINIPIVGDRLDLRVAGEWTKRNGYSFNETTDRAIDGRDLWSGRVTIGLKPFEKSAGLSRLGAFPGRRRPRAFRQSSSARTIRALHPLMVSTSAICRGDESFHRYLAFSRPSEPGMSSDLVLFGGCVSNSRTVRQSHSWPRMNSYLPHWSNSSSQDGRSLCQHVTQPRSLRIIQSEINPTYGAKNDTFEFNADYQITPALTLTSQTGYNKDQLHSTEDFNRFNTTPGIFNDRLAAMRMVDHTILRCDQRRLLRSAIGMFVQNGRRRSFTGTGLAVQSGSRGWHPTSAGHSISVWAPTTRIIRRWRIIMYS